jgi:hypothetical protein
MSEPSSSRVVNLFLVFGVIAIFLGLLIPVLLVREARLERARFAACQRHERVDCEPSFLWSLMK